MIRHYVLEGREVREVSTATRAGLIAWAEAFEATKPIKQTVTGTGVLVSTIFLGYDHALLERGPVLFETMAFEAADHSRVNPLTGQPPRESIDQWRYATYDAAEADHDRIVAELEALEAAGTDFLKRTVGTHD